MKFTFDTKELKRIDQALANSVKTVTDKRVAGGAMKRALVPMVQAAKRYAPVGKFGARVRGARYGKTPQGTDSQRQVGATRANVRAKLVKGEGAEVVRGLVGVSKRKGSAGYRTHLITRPNKHRRNVDDFLQRAFDNTFVQTAASYGKEIFKQVDRILKKL